MISYKVCLDNVSFKDDEPNGLSADEVLDIAFDCSTVIIDEDIFFDTLKEARKYAKENIETFRENGFINIIYAFIDKYEFDSDDDCGTFIGTVDYFAKPLESRS